MPYGLYVSAAGADVQNQRLQILSHNLANVETPGFKRELAVLQAQYAEAIEQGETTAGTGSLDDLGGGVRLAETVTDFSVGNFRQTGRHTDLAIDGDGFFVVQREGQQFLTRAGNFHVSAAGQLQTDHGLAVLAADGQPVIIDPTRPFQVQEDGSLAQENAQVALALVRPQSLGDLAKAGDNLFLPLADVSPVANGQRRVLTGFLEMSTVKPAQEMMELIETSRAYEANVRMIQNHDHMIGALVNRILGQ
jgi:flagellar basal-body rod protein FlgF